MTHDAAARPAFYQGQYLGPDDLAAMVDYAVDRAARHGLGAHTWGVGAGLQVVPTTNAGAVEYWVQPGVAWDGFGRTLLLPAPAQVTPELLRSAVYDPVADATAGSGRLVDIWLRWRVDARSAAPSGFADCSDGGFSRQLERVEIVARNIADVADTRQQVDVGGLRVDAPEAIGAWYPVGAPSRPRIDDASVPFQRFPSGTDPSMWLVGIGVVRWKVATPGSTGPLGTFQPLQPDDLEQARQRRRLVGVVAGTVHGAEGQLRLRSRFASPPTVWTDDPLWLEGTTRVDGDVRLFGGPDDRTRGGLDLRDGGGGDGGRRLRLSRHDRGGAGSDVRLQLGATGVATSRFVIGTETPPASPTDPPAFAEAVVVRSDARVGIGVASPADGPTHPLHVVSPLGIRQSALHLTGAPGWSSLAYNAHHDEANAKWMGGDPQRASSTIELDDSGGIPRFAVYTAPRTNDPALPPAWKLGLHLNGTTNHLGVGGGSIDQATVVVNDAVESSVRLQTAQSAVRQATFAVSGTTASISTLQADIALRTDGVARLTVKEDGDVGVGTTAPTNPLHVSGRPTDQDAGNLASAVALIENTSTTNQGDVLALRVAAGPTVIGEGNNYITFFAANTPVGRIEQTTLSNGTRALRLSSPGADFAEAMPVADGERVVPGDVVAVVGGEVTRHTEGASWITVVTDRAVVLGNAGAGSDGRAAVTLVGQVPVRVDGAAAPGDLLLPSGRGDGSATACSPAALSIGRAGEVFAEVVTSDDSITTALVGAGARSAALIAVVQRIAGVVPGG